jgi:hypothetical protein
MDFVIDLEPDNTGHGNVRSDDSKQFFQLTASHRRISGRVVYAVHGYLNGDEGDDKGDDREHASLIVLRFQLTNKNDPDEKRRWRHFHCQLRFGTVAPEGNEVEPRNDPVIKAFAPCQDGKIYLTETTADISKSRTYEFKGTASTVKPAKVGGEMRTDNKREESYQTKYLLTAEGDREKSSFGGREGEDEVYWTVVENPKEKIGVSDSMQVAVLLQRPVAGQDFTMVFTINALIDTKYQLAKAWKSLWAKKTQNLPFAVSRGTAPPPGVNAKLLRAVTDNDDQLLNELSWFHIPEQFLPKQKYSSGKMHIRHSSSADTLTCIIGQIKKGDVVTATPPQPSPPQ